MDISLLRETPSGIKSKVSVYGSSGNDISGYFPSDITLLSLFERIVHEFVIIGGVKENLSVRFPDNRTSFIAGISAVL